MFATILFRFPSRGVALAAFLALAAAGCGRIGPLQPPPDADAPAKPAVSAAPGSMEAISPQMKPRIPPITPPNQPFFLDPLLK